MIKKNVKYFVITIALLLISTLSVSAREVTIDDLGKQIDTYANKYEEDINSYYIIGNYVFTSHYKLDTRDIMLAARSISMNGDEFNGSNLNTALGKMTIHQVKRTFDNKYKPTGWEIIKNYVGETKLEKNTKFNIKYIDYEYLKDLYIVTLDADGDGDYQKSISIEENELIKESSITGKNAPKKAGYHFKAWVKEDGKTPWDFENDKVDKNTTLKATWYEEVNTDDLLEKAQQTINEGTKKNGYYYDVIFDKKESSLTFEVFDKNKKNSEISNTGLIGDIVNIVKNKNVKALTISNNQENVIFDADDVDNGAGPTSNAWKQFALLLCKLTGKDCSDEKKVQESFKTITLGDLLKLNDLTLKITLEEDKARSQNNKIEETYTIKFNYDANSIISTVSNNDIKSLQEKFNYNYENTYNITGENGEYKVTGYVTEQDGVNGFGSNPSKYYFAYTIELEDEIDTNAVTIKIPKKDDPKSDNDYNIVKGLSKEGKLTVLMEVEEKENIKYRDIIIMIDEIPTKLRIDFSELRLEKSSKFIIQSVDDVEDAITKLGSDFGWKKEDEFKTDFSIEDKNVKINGFLPILDSFSNDKKPFGEDDKTGYYLPFVIKTLSKKQITDNKKTTVEFIHKGESSKKITADSFDGEDTLYVLKHLDKDAIDKTFTIIVDMDGEGIDYAPYTLTFDWSNLELQDKSMSTDSKIANNKDNSETTEHNGFVSEDDKNKLKEWGYNFDLENKDLILTKSGDKYNLSGTLKEQDISDKAGFKETKGYYIPIKIYGPTKEQLNGSSVDLNSWIVEVHDEDGNPKTIKPSDADYKNGFITVLFKLKDNEEKKLTYKIDWDGYGKYFLPFEETIDYTSLNLIESSKVFVRPQVNGKEYECTFYEGDNIINEINKVLEKNNITVNGNDYRTFAGWYKMEEDSLESSKTYQKIEDNEVVSGHKTVKIEGHWNINVDKFVEDVVTNSKGSSDNISLNKMKKEITININKPNITLNELAKTSIPGTIAYILEKNEIKDITLEFGKQNVEFSSTNLKSKEEIIKEIKDAFDKELDNHEAVATLDQLEYSDKDFSIKIGKVDNTVTLIDENESQITEDTDKKYTFKFNSDFAVVNQNPDSNLGAKNITDAISKNYKTIYIDDIDYTEEKTINISANQEVTIKPIDGKKDTTITTTGDSVNYAVVVNKGNVTFEDLKITGGKKAEIKVEQNATVTVKNIDVSGNIEEPKPSKDSDEMNANILVEGKLTVNSSIINNNETYKKPTIALVKAWTYPGIVSGEEKEESKNDIPTAAKVNAPSMTKNERYSIIEVNKLDGIDSTEETYYGEFYYVNKNNSYIYYMAIMDDKITTSSPYDKIKIYYYNDNINITELGYKSGETPTSGNEVFDKLVLKDNEKTEIKDNTKPNELGFLPHNTNVVYAKYKKNPSASISYQQVDGLNTKNGNLSGTLTTQTNGKYIIPVNLSSEKFNESTTLKVTDPNGNTNNYKYSDDTEDGIAKVSTTKTMTLSLEAIKSSKITGENGKLYTMELDIDGNEKNYEPETYEVDYNNVTTLEEKINKAAENTSNAKNLTITKNNIIKNLEEKFSYKYDKEKDLTLYNNDEYSFRYKNVVTSHTGPIIIAVKKLVTPQSDGESRPKINDNWEFANFFSQVSMGSHEISLLQDVMKNTSINAIDKVKKVNNEENTYEVTLNKDKLSNWLNNAYLDGIRTEPKKEQSQDLVKDEDNNIKLKVVLDSNEKYLVSIKTMADFDITTNSGISYKNNQIDVQFKDINNTKIESPLKFLAKDGEELMPEDIKKFYEDCKKWHKAKTGAEIYEG